jgi:site-specific recombinase XerD
LPAALSDRQVRQLLSVIRNPVHRTVFTLMYACGLRISEAATLPVSAIDRAHMVLRIIGKGNKERRVPLPQPVLAELETLWRRHRNRTWMFPNQTGHGPVSTGVLVRPFQAAVTEAGFTTRHRTPCDTATPPGCWRTASIPAWFRFCSVTRVSPRPRSTPT